MHRMSLALWPVFEDQHGHGLVDEGAVLLDVSDELDGIATAAGRTPLSGFDAYADVPDQVMAERAMAAEGVPDLSDLPTAWHDPADAVATLDTLMARIGGSASWPGGHDHDRENVLDCLAAFRMVLRDAAGRGTRFHLTVA